MRDDDALPVSTPTSSSLSNGIPKREGSSDSSSNSSTRSRYKFWALAAILFLALWSMITGTVTLRWSEGDLSGRLDEEYKLPVGEDLDVLDLEEREKLVKHMWDVYTNSHRLRLTGFWRDAFVAAYEDLTSEIPEVRQEAITEIAKMSIRDITIYPPPVHSSFSLGPQNIQDLNRKQAKRGTRK